MAQHTTNLDGCLEFEENRLRDEDFASFCAKVFDFIFLKLYGLSRSVPAHYGGKKKSKRESA